MMNTESSEKSYSKIREPKREGYPPITPEHIADSLIHLGIKVEDYIVDVMDYRKYFDDARYKEDFPDYYPANLPEKSLEHYLAAQFLNLKDSDIYIDIASQHSPVPIIYSRLYGAKAFRQDLDYPSGLQGDTIGGDAANMPIPDEFATKMGLHCSFEHFEGDSDIRFIHEAARVLKPGGVVCIAPLYMADEYSIVTDSVVALTQNIRFENNAVVCCVKGYNNRHGRFYDPKHIERRIVKNLGDLIFKLIRVTNVKQIDQSCYLEFVGIIEKPSD